MLDIIESYNIVHHARMIGRRTYVPVGMDSEDEKMPKKRHLSTPNINMNVTPSDVELITQRIAYINEFCLCGHQNRLSDLSNPGTISMPNIGVITYSQPSTQQELAIYTCPTIEEIMNTTSYSSSRIQFSSDWLILKWKPATTEQPGVACCLYPEDARYCHLNAESMIQCRSNAGIVQIASLPRGHNFYVDCMMDDIL